MFYHNHESTTVLTLPSFIVMFFHLQLLSKFNGFSELWLEDPQEKIVQFVEGDHVYAEYEAQIKYVQHESYDSNQILVGLMKQLV